MTDEALIAWLRSLKGLGWSNEAADRIEELAERNKELTLQLLATHGQAADSVDKLAKAVKCLTHYATCPIEEIRLEARATLAELKGETK